MTRQGQEHSVSRLRRAGVLLGTVVGQVVAAFVFLGLVFSTDRVALVLVALAAFVGGSVAVWRRRASDARRALVLVWGCALGLVLLLLVAGALGLLGA